MASGVNFGADDYTVKVGLMAAPQGVEGDSASPPPGQSVRADSGRKTPDKSEVPAGSGGIGDHRPGS
jgi:hypothetical protein